MLTGFTIHTGFKIHTDFADLTALTGHVNFAMAIILF